MAKRAKKKKQQLPANLNDIIGRPGGIARAQKLTAARRKEIAELAANARWKIRGNKNG
jgi:hypothetical protein